jgi:hypothetical protein
MIAAYPRFPLNLGVIATTGRTGLLVMVPAALAGIAGLLLLRSRRSLGMTLTAMYCAFWAAVFLAGLPRVWNARQSFCLKGLNFCIYSPWVARVTVFAIVAPFLLSAWWALVQARKHPRAG